MEGMTTPRFKINPNFRLTSRYLSVAWHLVDPVTIRCEAAIAMPGRNVYTVRGNAEILAQHHDGMIDLIYHTATDFNNARAQTWLRRLMRDIIRQTAERVLPERVRYWERLKGIHGTGVTVRRLRKNILGCCTAGNHIYLQPFLVIFRQEWMDGVILHEMAHYRHKHHRKAFWDYLSTLLGHDSRLAKVKNDIALSPYYAYYLYLTQNR